MARTRPGTLRRRDGGPARPRGAGEDGDTEDTGATGDGSGPAGAGTVPGAVPGARGVPGTGEAAGPGAGGAGVRFTGTDVMLVSCAAV
ncbi:hypothetical protein GCM10010156_06530 [Planobispora rosea]|uniref:Uncharacterized protein n=1 Tax=Planobispora rosea TaxID=35762 RepID=A0A8J3RZU7_PLARO|nr:hypothetical protein GCM10010156_06530 [Planobispora rosea]GIH82524.1 hypothetical protein Pro02_09320 [Planobispora rosea]